MAAELVLEYVHRVEHRVGPVADPRVQAGTGDEEKRKAAPGFLIADLNVTILVKRHVVSPRSTDQSAIAPSFSGRQPRKTRTLGRCRASYLDGRTSLYTIG